jgi:GNAT superfamily N-acetyltransferase
VVDPWYQLVTYDERYRAFVSDSWRRSARRCPRYRDVERSDYNAIVSDAIAEATAGPVILAVGLSEPSMVYGWCAARAGSQMGEHGLRVHYAYVRPAVRRMGVAIAMVEAIAKPLGVSTPGWIDLAQPPYWAELKRKGWRLWRHSRNTAT